MELRQLNVLKWLLLVLLLGASVAPVQASDFVLGVATGVILADDGNASEGTQAPASSTRIEFKDGVQVTSRTEVIKPKLWRRLAGPEGGLYVCTGQEYRTYSGRKRCRVTVGGFPGFMGSMKDAPELKLQAYLEHIEGRPVQLLTVDIPEKRGPLTVRYQVESPVVSSRKETSALATRPESTIADVSDSKALPKAVDAEEHQEQLASDKTRVPTAQSTLFGYFAAAVFLIGVGMVFYDSFRVGGALCVVSALSFWLDEAHEPLKSVFAMLALLYAVVLISKIHRIFSGGAETTYRSPTDVELEEAFSRRREEAIAIQEERRRREVEEQVSQAMSIEESRRERELVDRAIVSEQISSSAPASPVDSSSSRPGRRKIAID